MARLFGLCLTAILALGAGCGGGSGHQGDLLAEEGDKAGEAVTVQVISRHFQDVVIYLHVGASRFRLGMATGNSTSEFKVPWRQLRDGSQVGLSAEAIGDESRATSDVVQVAKGGTIVWALETGLNSTSIQIH